MRVVVVAIYLLPVGDVAYSHLIHLVDSVTVVKALLGQYFSSNGCRGLVNCDLGGISAAMVG